MKVAVVMGSKSDLPTVMPAIETLESFGVKAVARILSAHRTPEAAADFAKSAREDCFEVIIAAAGKAAHLAGVLAGHTTLPVIGLPIKSSLMDGLDSLLSMVQMPDGIPVATVGVNGAKNAGLLAVQMLSLKYGELADKLNNYKKEMESAVLSADRELNMGGIE